MSFAATYQTLGEYQSLARMVDEVMTTPLAAGLELLAARPFDDAYVLTLGPDA
jgi:hypothetical protein